MVKQECGVLELNPSNRSNPFSNLINYGLLLGPDSSDQEFKASTGHLSRGEVESHVAEAESAKPVYTYNRDITVDGGTQNDAGRHVGK